MAVCVKSVLLYLWQLPQHLLALFLLWFMKRVSLVERVIPAPAKPDTSYIVMERSCRLSCFSLGKYIFTFKGMSETTDRHEQGHSKQSLLLGPFYLLLIGLPSVIGNIIYRFNRSVTPGDYYKQPWEAWADKLGGVRRGY